MSSGYFGTLLLSHFPATLNYPHVFEDSRNEMFSLGTRGNKQAIGLKNEAQVDPTS